MSLKKNFNIGPTNFRTFLEYFTNMIVHDTFNIAFARFIKLEPNAYLFLRFTVICKQNPLQTISMSQH